MEDPEQQKEDLCNVPGKGDSKCKRSPKTDRRLVWLRDGKQARMAQKRTNDEAEEGVGSPGHGKELGFSKCD